MIWLPILLILIALCLFAYLGFGFYKDWKKIKQENISLKNQLDQMDSLKESLEKLKYENQSLKSSIKNLEGKQESNENDHSSKTRS